MATNNGAFDLETNAILAQITRDITTPSYVEALLSQVGEVNRIVKEFLAQAARIEGSRDYTPEGRAHRLGELALTEAGRLDKLRATLTSYDEHIDAVMKARTVDIPAPGDAVVQGLRDHEIRSYYTAAHADQLSLQAEYLSWCASASGDERCKAIESSPVPLLSAEVLQQGREARALRMSPEASRQIRELRQLRSALASAISSAFATLHAHGLPADDPLTRVAAGTA